MPFGNWTTPRDPYPGGQRRTALLPIERADLATVMGQHGPEGSSAASPFRLLDCIIVYGIQELVPIWYVTRRVARVGNLAMSY